MRSLIFFLFALPCYALEPLSLEEKVGQLLLVHFNGEKVNEEAKALVQDVHVGGFIYFDLSNGLYSPDHVRQLSTDLQKLARIPLFIAVDQEGGAVVRLKKGFTVFPGNKALEVTNDPALTEQSAYVIGRELLSVGINLNLAPVVDVNCNPRNPVIGLRSFGNDPETVVSYAEKALQGYHRAGILACLKHFPGHGDVAIDSHFDLPVLRKSREELNKTELIPFFRLAKQADTIMTAHLLIPTLDAANCTTLSPEIISILRKEIGYEGVVLSDSFAMKALFKNGISHEEAAISAFNAGCDILTLAGKQFIDLEFGLEAVKRIHQALVSAVKSGRISEQRLDQAVERILRLKNKLNTCQEDLFPFEEHQALARQIAEESVKVIKKTNLERIFPLSQKKIALFIPKSLKNNFQQTQWMNLGKERQIYFFDNLEELENQMEEIKEEVDLFFLCLYKEWKRIKIQRPAVMLWITDPPEPSLFSDADVILKTNSPSPISLQVGYECLID